MTAKLILLALAATLATSATQAPRRIVSVDLCADQLVLALADRGQIAGLSRNAADPTLSAAAAKARGLPILRDSSETLLAANPDTIVAVPAWFGAPAGHRYRVLTTPDAQTYAGIAPELRTVGAGIGHADRAEALIRAMDLRMAAVPRGVGRGKVAAYYQRRGYMTGTGTLVDDLMGRVGLVNLSRKLGKPVLSQLSLEELVAAKPDYLILESATATVTDQGTEMLHHPALRGIPKLWIPQAWTVCGSPDYVRAAESLVRQMQRMKR